MQYLSPEILNDEEQVRDWLDIFEMSPLDTAIQNAQRGLDNIVNRLEEYRKIRTQCMVIGFGDDLVVPPHLCREVADSIPDCTYEEVPGCGHYGYLEKSAQVNELVVNFFRTPAPR
jgi:pimeloyl-ACP methyl ester carboxylesterase